MTGRVSRVSLLAAMLLLAPAAQARTALGELPSQMLGVWGFSAEDCTDEDSDGRVVVQARAVSFFAATFKLRSISRLADGRLRAATRRFDEGEPRIPRDTLELKLLSSDRLSIRSGREGAVTYERCRGGPH
ncbi:MAG: hypothetical protein HXY30_12110 [Pseudorhodoplanes sp.]|nr:hypothetical protein [Pseudorhodoplanes sp.]